MFARARRPTQGELDKSEVAAPSKRAVFSHRPPPNLLFETPAWTERGRVHLGPTSLFASPLDREQMLRHEEAHAKMQRSGGIDESAGARAYAEQHAERAERAEQGVEPPSPAQPVPSVLAHPPVKLAPWDTVHIGTGSIVGEVVEKGVTVRIELSYSDVGVTTGPEDRTYFCGAHPFGNLPDVAKKLRQAAKAAAKMNDRMPAAAAERVEMILVKSGQSSRYRFHNGKGVIVLDGADLAAGAHVSTVEHESSHGIFETLNPTVSGARQPTPIAQRFASLWIALRQTSSVDVPTAKFDPKSPPPTAQSASGKPAGLVMVADVVWAGAGGHPWDNVDEFFASAHAAYVHDEKLLKTIMKHYEKADSKIKALSKELLTLLAAVGDSKARGKLKAPADVKAADQELTGIRAPTEVSQFPGLENLIDPTLLPGRKITPCAGTSSTTTTTPPPTTTTPPTKPTTKPEE